MAARHGNIEVAGILLARNPNLHYLPNNNGWFPIHYAATNHRKSKDVFLYFYRLTRDGQHGQPNPYQGPTGVSLLAELIEYKFYDLALQVIGQYPDLGRHKRLANDASALVVILNDCSIVNKHSLKFWQSFIYYCVSKDESEAYTPIFHIITSLLPWLVGKSIVNKMVLHHQAVKLLKCLCYQLTTLNDTQVVSLAKDAVIEAASLDISQVILNIVEAYPMSVYFKNSDEQNILHIAVKKRSENVFNLVCGTNVVRSTLLNFPDINLNSVLHLAGKLAPPHKLNLVSGAALQMQRELQWFKEVKKISPSRFLSYRNRNDKTPSMVFTEEHKELKEAGEKWMKDTATSCTIAAALIVTVVFAAAITVPGGNNGGNGLPIFSNNTVFTVFAISNAASLFTSATSLLVFLSILTSRYAEQDFLYALPKRLIIGLFTLFLSIIFMMSAFSATVYLVFGHNRRGVLIVVAAFACLPVTSFVLLQFPLLVDLVSSTYGRGIFNQRGFPQLLV
ncbi:PREDICTED: ankyrin repeat-containing protein NPR4-like [Ipomoea nil]|uniref:ankyrin repeat-containing protein NPR4-like n=1 Tax=Ipomoea nil TaxID=35883 RepID=UPI000901EAB3|nr:PREDICTED: ankyrin repeat-containing protein NPR4-like [Ipomoea nil]